MICLFFTRARFLMLNFLGADTRAAYDLCHDGEEKCTGRQVEATNTTMCGIEWDGHLVLGPKRR